MNERAPHPTGALRIVSETLADRLSSERQRWFHGRQAELSELDAVFADSDCALWFLSGHTGVGKTSLLLEYERRRKQAGGAVVYLDGAECAAKPNDAQRALLQQLLDTLSGPAHSKQSPRPVLLVDSYERLGTARSWLHNELLPLLPSNTLLVFASRFPAPPALSLDSGWLRLARYGQLEPFTELVSRQFLQSLEVPPAAESEVLKLAGGYPLALVIAADALKKDDADALTTEHVRQVQDRLLQLLCPQATSNGQQLALDACALAHTTTVELLERVLLANPRSDHEHAPELFEWLAGLAFMERGAFGLHPQPLARLALSGRAQREHPLQYLALYRPVRAYCVDEIAQGARPESALADLLFLDRDVSFVQLLGVSDAERVEPVLSVPAVSEHEQVAALIQELEGKEAGLLARALLRSEPRSFEITRDGSVDALLHVAKLESAKGVPLVGQDPAARLAERFVREHPLESGANALFFRWFMSRNEYQAPRGRVMTITARQTQLVLATPRLAYTLCVYRTPDEWSSLWEASNAQRELVGTFTLGAHRYSLLAFSFEQRSLRDSLVDAWQPGTDITQLTPAAPPDDPRQKVITRVAELGRSARLTEREKQILERLCLGGSFEDIATALSIRPRTVKFHQENILRKTGCSSRIELFRRLI